MHTRETLIKYCLSLPDTYENYPFHDANWTAMRCTGNQKTFAFIYERQEGIWMNLKCDPAWTDFWRNAYSSVIPAYHMNKHHWNSVIVDGVISDQDLERMIAESYDLVKPKKKADKVRL